MPADDWVHGFVKNAQAANTAPKPTNFFGDTANSAINTVTGHLTNLPTGHGIGANVVGPLLGFGGLLGAATTGLGALGVAPEIAGALGLAGTGAFTSGTQDLRDQVNQYGKIIDPGRALGHAGLGAAIAAVPIAGETGIPGILKNAATFSAANTALGSAGEVLNTGKVTAEQAGGSAFMGAGMGAMTGLFNRAPKEEVPLPEAAATSETAGTGPDTPPPGGPSITPRPENTGLPPLREEALPSIDPNMGLPKAAPQELPAIESANPLYDSFMKQAEQSLPDHSPQELQSLGEAFLDSKGQTPDSLLPQIGSELPPVQEGVDYTPLGDYLAYQDALKTSDTFNPTEGQGLPKPPEPAAPPTAPAPVQPIGPQLGADGHFDVNTLNHPTGPNGEPINNIFNTRTAANRAVKNLGLNKETVTPYQTGQKQWQLHFNGEEPPTPTGVPPETPPPTAPGAGNITEHAPAPEPTGVGGGSGPIRPPVDLRTIQHVGKRGFYTVDPTDPGLGQFDPNSVSVLQDAVANGKTVEVPYRGNKTGSTEGVTFTPTHFIRYGKPGAGNNRYGVWGSTKHANGDTYVSSLYFDQHGVKGSGSGSGMEGVPTPSTQAPTHTISREQYNSRGRAQSIHTDVARAAQTNLQGIKDLLPPEHPGYKEAQRLEKIMQKPIKDWGAARASLERLAKSGSLEDFQKAMAEKAGPC